MERITKIENNIATVDLGDGIHKYQVLPDLRFATRNGVYDTKRAMVEYDPLFEGFKLDWFDRIEKVIKNLQDVFDDPDFDRVIFGTD